MISKIFFIFLIQALTLLLSTTTTRSLWQISTTTQSRQVNSQSSLCVTGIQMLAAATKTWFTTRFLLVSFTLKGYCHIHQSKVGNLSCGRGFYDIPTSSESIYSQCSIDQSCLSRQSVQRGNHRLRIRSQIHQHLLLIYLNVSHCIYQTVNQAWCTQQWVLVWISVFCYVNMCWLHFFFLFKEVFSLCCCFSETILQVFNTEGEFLLKFGSNGEGNGQFNAPTGVAVDVNGNIIVADWGNSRIQVRRMNHFYFSKNRLIQTSVSFFIKWHPTLQSCLIMAYEMLPKHH